MRGRWHVKLGSQSRRREITAYDANLLNPAGKGALGSFEFQNHAAGDDPRLHEMVDLFAGDGGKNFFAVEHACDIREIDEVIGCGEFGAGRSHVVRVDVVKLVVGAQSEAGGYRKQFFAPQRFEEANVDTGQVAHEAEPAFDIVVHQRGGGKTGGIRGGNSDCRLALGGDGGGEAFIQQAGEKHDRGVAGFPVGDAKGGNKFACNAHALKGGGEKTAAPVDDQDLMSVASKSCNVV